MLNASTVCIKKKAPVLTPLLIPKVYSIDECATRRGKFDWSPIVLNIFDKNKN